MTRGPARMPLTPRQAQVLTAAATGAPLSQVASRLGITREQTASHLSRAYQRLDVTHLPRDQRRAAAVRIAVRRGLIPNPTETAP
ncbi:response regulator transcription factor [Streptomyces sp. NPDC001858]